MEVAFVHVPGRRAEALVSLDGRVCCVPSPGKRQVLPHDVGQFIVEHSLRWQTGFWGYIARGVVFPGMYQKSGSRPPHGEERSKAAIRGAKNHLAEVEMLAGAVAAIARGNVDRDPDKIRHILNETWWPPQSTAARLPVADIQRACEAFRQAEADWRALAIGGSLRFRWSFRANPLAPDNPLDEARNQRRRAADRRHR